MLGTIDDYRHVDALNVNMFLHNDQKWALIAIVTPKDKLKWAHQQIVQAQHLLGWES